MRLKEEAPLSKNWKNEHAKGRMDRHAKKERRTSKKSKALSGSKTKLEGTFILEADKWVMSGDAFAGRVVEVHKRYAFVSPEPNEYDIGTDDPWLATVPRKYLQAVRAERNLICVGDKVLCVPGNFEVGEVSEELPVCQMQHREPRKSKISRRDPLTPDRAHVLAANFDQLFIVASAFDPEVKWGLIDRYLVLSESEGISAKIVLTKRDVLEQQSAEAQETFRRNVESYRQIGYEVFVVQGIDSGGVFKKELESLQEAFRDKISLLSGHSGVGKSSIVNGMAPEIEQDVEEDSIFYKGRHTTTYSSLIRLAKVGGFVVDTPGIRSFSIEELDATHLSWCFKEFRNFTGKCKYRECQHREEPDCAIKAAVANGAISEQRYQSYLAILSGVSGREGRTRDISVE